jgi:hypothetical protein
MGTILRKKVGFVFLIVLVALPVNAVLAQPSRVVINEFMVDPPPDFVPYIELFNSGNEPVAVKDWVLLRRSGTENTGGLVTDQEIELLPDDYLVITPNSAAIESIYGEIYQLEMDLFPGFENLDEIRLLTESGETVDSLRFELSIWGGSGVALERRRADFPSEYRENWAESPAELFGTPGSENLVDPDYPFTITSIQVSGSGDLFLIFNSAINPMDVNADNFEVDGENPDSAELTDQHTVRLSFDRPLGSGEKILQTGEIRSLPGWSISDGEQFHFIIYDEYSAGDVVINEFMYNPPMDYPAYVELYNRSDKFLNLRNWRLQRKEISSQPGGVITTGTLALRPNEYLVITNSSEAAVNIFGDIKLFEMSNYPGFTVTIPEQIRLFDSEGVIADSLEYTPSTWGGKDVALERKSPEVGSGYVENWAESTSMLLGTPGRENEAQPDSDRPILTNLTFFENRGFLLEFNKTVEPESATKEGHYSFNPELTIQQIEVEGSEVLILFRQEFQNGRTYSVTAEGVTDLFGNELLKSTHTLDFLEFDEFTPGDIVINEILYRRARAGSPEFVELYNRTEKTIDLSGSIFFAGSNSTTLPPNTVLRSNEYIVFTDQQDFAGESKEIIYLSGFPGLSNTGSHIGFKNQNGVTIDSLTYRPEWSRNRPGISLERKDPSALSIDPANWMESSDERGATPAEQNSRFQVDSVPPEILFANLSHPDSLGVIFSEFVDLKVSSENQQSDFSSTQDGFGTIFKINGEDVHVIDYDESRANRVVLSTGQIRLGEENTLSAEGLKDFKGNSTTANHPVTQPVNTGDLVINEIMFHPLTGGDDAIPEQSEYLEIYNRQPYSISLEGLFLHDEPDENGSITRIEPVSSRNRRIPAKGYALFFPEPEPVSLSGSRTGVVFDLSDELDPFGLRAERAGLSLTLSGRAIYLADSTQTVIDNVDYSPEWHNPNLITTQGISLERIHPGRDSNDPENWGSNTTVIGGTPLAQNSLHHNFEGDAPSEGIELTPNPFAPESEGDDHELNINYEFEDPDYLLKVKIFDRYGRLVRNLANSYTAGYRGSLVWDGRTDDGKRNRIGIYIVYVEAYNGSTGDKKIFRETAVLARQF